MKTTRRALEPEANADQAEKMTRYMKFVAPFLGVPTPPRRLALRTQWRDLNEPTSDELGEACVALMNLREREYHYAACDLLEKYREVADEYFLAEYVEELLTTKSWWDTVDGLGSSIVSPLCWRYEATDLVLGWSRSPNIWLNRAAIQHQRGWKKNTDIPFVLELCDAHSAQREFFVAKAIGWALRDLARLDPDAVRGFLQTHPGLSSTAIREARRGLKELNARPV
ncbi:MAG: DNA alkylation repair protein [Acidimicrobiales bacterium]